MALPADWISNFLLAIFLQLGQHQTGLPIQLALQVPPKLKKTVLDAVNGYHCPFW